MKGFWKDFLLRGLICAGSGPLVLAIIYGILGATGATQSLTPREVCLGIITITVLAFFAAGMTAIYQLEQLPLVSAILIHGIGLYVAYILTYLINGWLVQQLIPILIFSGIFIVGYGVIWAIIYFINRTKTTQLNEKLKSQRVE